MDILEQYKKQNPQIFSQSDQSDVWQESDEASALVRLVIRLSGGRIQDSRHASYVLLCAAVVMIVASALIILLRSGSGMNQPSKDLINRPQPQEAFMPR